jgi:RHS repeat-associated protein
VTNHFRFPGQYFDTETGLHYNYYRYYDPIIGRYLRPDPIGLWGGSNAFTYTLNNPIKFEDRKGLLTEAYYLFYGISAYDIDYGGQSSWVRPSGSEFYKWYSKLSPGQKIALYKMTGGSAAVVGGALNAQPFLISGGIVLFADGFAYYVAEELGGDTSNIPNAYQLLWEIAKKAAESWPSGNDPCGSVSFE